MSIFTDIRDEVVGGVKDRYTKNSGKTDYSKILRDAGALYAATSKGGKDFLLGKKGGYDQYNVDPNYEVYQKALLDSVRGLQDPSKNPFFKAAMKRAGKFHPGGARDRAFSMASLEGQGALYNAVSGAYGQAQPIVTHRQPTSGALPGLADAYARYTGYKEGSKSGGVQAQGATRGLDIDSIMQLVEMLNTNPNSRNYFRDPNGQPLGEPAEVK